MSFSSHSDRRIRYDSHNRTFNWYSCTISVADYHVLTSYPYNYCTAHDILVLMFMCFIAKFQLTRQPAETVGTLQILLSNIIWVNVVDSITFFGKMHWLELKPIIIMDVNQWTQLVRHVHYWFSVRGRHTSAVVISYVRGVHSIFSDFLECITWYVSILASLLYNLYFLFEFGMT